MSLRNLLEHLYDRWFEEPGGRRLCAGIPEAACGRVGWNFFVQLAARLATKLGDTLASPRLVLSWLMAGIGVSVGLIGLVVPAAGGGLAAATARHRRCGSPARHPQVVLGCGEVPFRV